jgi:two-component system nitrate/nitrite response regulator NarL
VPDTGFRQRRETSCTGKETVEHIFVTSSGVLLERWQLAFPNATVLSSISALNTLTPGNDRLLWLELGPIPDSKRVAVVSDVVSHGWPVIVMSYTPDDDEAYATLSAGAHGYCHSMAAPAQLLEIATVITSGGLWVGPGLMQRMLSLSLRAGVKSDVSQAMLLQLTPRERMVAEQVARGASNREISEDLKIAERTVKAHLSVCFEKLQVRDRVQLALAMHNLLPTE